jgi:hypothetical protein
LVWTTSEGGQELLSLDSKIKVHAYEVTPAQLGQLMRAGLVCLRELSLLDESPMQPEAHKALLDWNLFLPDRMRVKPNVAQIPDTELPPQEPPAAAAPPAAPESRKEAA